MNSMDILAILIIVFVVIIGYRKNLINSFVDWLSIAGSLFISLRFFGSFTKVVRNTPIVSDILKVINDNIIVKIAEFDKEVTLTLDSFKTMKLSKEFIYFFKKSDIFKSKTEVPISELSLGLVINVGSIVLLFVICVFIFKFLIRFLDDSTNMAGLTTINKGGSAVFSILRSFVYISIIAIIVFNISIFFNSGFFYDLYHKSAILKAFYSSNLISWMFGV